jgi:hypothetical protein
MENPWHVESLEAFYYLKCPECAFDTKKEMVFRDHAVENHPLSIVYFGENYNQETKFTIPPIVGHENDDISYNDITRQSNFPFK